MFIHEYPDARALRRTLRAIRDRAYVVRSIGMSPQEARRTHQDADRCVDHLEALENIEATTADAPYLRDGVVVVELEVGPAYQDALARFLPYLGKLQLLARGKAATDATFAQRIVQDILDAVELAKSKAQDVDHG